MTDSTQTNAETHRPVSPVSHPDSPRMLDGCTCGECPVHGLNSYAEADTSHIFDALRRGHNVAVGGGTSGESYLPSVPDVAGRDILAEPYEPPHYNAAAERARRANWERWYANNSPIAERRIGGHSASGDCECDIR